MSENSPIRRWVIKGGKWLLRAIGKFQSKHSLVGTRPFLDNSEFPWVAELEGQWLTIREELNGVMQNLEDVPAFHQLSPDQKRISKGDNWKTFAFYVFGIRLEDSCQRCPQTVRALEQLPGLQNAWFSILAPRYHIPAHQGPTRAVVRCHLALQVPEDAKNCWIRVDQEVRGWEEGKIMVFDDTYDHEVKNDTDEVRVVLFVDVDRPSDLIGSWFNKLFVRLIRSSAYVKDPLKNLAAWNRGVRPADQPNIGTKTAYYHDC
jgi:aspartyl/asparaginyl beta-hydroxylase (cupin superfamily)